MSIFNGILLVVCVVFLLYKAILKIIKLSQKKVSKNNNVIKDYSVDTHFHSVPTFDFPNVQSESDLKIMNSGPDLRTEPTKIKVTQYCKY